MYYKKRVMKKSHIFGLVLFTTGVGIGIGFACSNKSNNVAKKEPKEDEEKSNFSSVGTGVGNKNKAIRYSINPNAYSKQANSIFSQSLQQFGYGFEFISAITGYLNSYQNNDDKNLFRGKMIVLLDRPDYPTKGSNFANAVIEISSDSKRLSEQQLNNFFYRLKSMGLGNTYKPFFMLFQSNFVK